MTVLVVMGVSGSGKTTIARGVAEARGWTLLEGDAFHPASNVAKMRSGTPLTDEDRWPWLRAIADAIDACRARGESAVVACSALKRAYRAVLIGDRPDVVLVYLRGSQTLIGERLRVRKGHFMPPGLLDSQFATLEEPGAEEAPVIADIGGTPDAIISDIEQKLRERGL
jgi:carbohydrate kinase (thermoresistant glucokinase family)